MADAATDALIAQLCAEEELPYYANPYYDVDSGEDSDYGRSKRKKPKGGRKGAKAKEGKASSSAGPAAATAGAATTATKACDTAGPAVDQEDKENQGVADGNVPAPGNVELSATGRRKRKDAGQKGERTAPKSWSEEEETKFQQALDLHGRNWKACSEHIGSRDARAVASHAQKAFIRMCLAGQPLPAKVAETGLGWTLSGKLLDPNSSAARAYGFRRELLGRLEGATLQVALAGIQQEGLEDTEPELDQDGNPIPRPVPAPRAPRAPREPKPPREPRQVKQPPAKRRKAEEAAADPQLPPQQTEYSRNRPRRELAGQRMVLGDTSESLSLVRCSDYIGAPASGAPLSQPYSVQMHAEALLTMDFHSHLSCCEVIGLLGGSWDPQRKHIVVQEAYPCRRADGSDATTSVELAPEAQVEAQAAMEERGQTCVGWYHSHPVFEPSPSQKDMDNQRNYQALFRCEASRLEPFLGVILGPFDVALPAPVTAVTVFSVQQRSSQLVPYHIRYQVLPAEEVPDMEVTEKLVALVEMFQADVGRVDLRQAWRGCTRLAGGTAQGPPLSKLQKLLATLRHRLAHLEQEEVEQFLHQLLYHLQQNWALPLGIKLEDVRTLPATELMAQAGQAAQPVAAGKAAQPGEGPARGSGDGRAQHQQEHQQLTAGDVLKKEEEEEAVTGQEQGQQEVAQQAGQELAAGGAGSSGAGSAAEEAGDGSAEAADGSQEASVGEDGGEAAAAAAAAGDPEAGTAAAE